MKNIAQNTSYQSFIKALKERVRQAQYQAMKKVNKEYLLLHWGLGKMILEKQKKEGWGKSVVEQISKDLRTEFVGVRGFSARNLWRMKQFYETYGKSEILPPMVAEIITLIFIKIHNKLKNA